MAHKRGRPLTPLDPEASKRARLGAELRGRREAKGLTLKDLGAITGYSQQHISEVERAKATPTQSFITACDDALRADGKLLLLLPGALDEAVHERETARQERADARRAARQAEGEPALPYAATHCEAGDSEDVDPTDRRGLIAAGAAAALGVPLLGIDAAPTRASRVDPELPAHYARLLDHLGRLDAAFGPQDLLDSVRYEAGRIATHRKAARGELHTELLRVEAHWAEFAAWLSNDTGRWRERDAWTEDALRLAQEAGCADVIALARMRQGQWAIQARDAPRAVAFTEEALRTPGATTAIRARCALRAAHGHALADDATSCERRLASAAEAAEAGVRNPGAVTPGEITANTARCWLYMKPTRAVALYEDALRAYPRDQVRDRGLHQARFALACAHAGELDRAQVEGSKALAMKRATQSATAALELRQLGRALKAA